MNRFFQRTGQALAAFAALGAGAYSVPARAAFSAPVTAVAWTANPDDALLFEMRLNQYRLGDGVRGYATPTGICVDFADVIVALDIPVRLDKQSRRATGWAFDEGHTLVIDRNTDSEHITNGVGKVAPNDIQDTPEGWCVSTTALSRWLGVKLEADTKNALLFVRSDRKLPPQLAAERRARTAISRPVFDLASLPHSIAQYGGIRAPSVDVIASIGGLRDHLSGNRLDTQYEVFVSGEVGPVAYDARLSSSGKGLPDSVRLRAYRTDPTGGLLGPLHATNFAVGDVQGMSTALVAQSSIGRGASITNRPVERNDNFDKTDFRGELPRGWDAELYRNGQLLAFANDRADGRYEFLDVPLQYGQNRFEVVLYGPQGQVRREVKSVPVGIDSIPPRKTFYWAGVEQAGHDLINATDSTVLPSLGWRAGVGLERGIDARTSFATVLHSIVNEYGVRQDYAEGSLRRAIGPALVEVSGAQSLSGGTALQAQMLGELGKTHVEATTIWAGGGFTSDRILNDVTGIHEIGLDRYFGNGRTSVPIHIDARYTTRATGPDSLEVTARSSAGFGRVSMTGEVAWRQDHTYFGPDPPSDIEASILANARIGRFRLRGETHFRISPEARFQSATLVGEWSAGGALLHPNDWRAEIGYDRDLHRARAAIGYVRRFDRMAVSASGEAASDGSLAAGLSVAFSLGPDPRASGGVRLTSDKLASHGSTLVRVYRDINGNGIRDPGEPLEKNVQISAGRIPVESVTDANGEVIVDGLEPFQPVLIGVDGSSLPDPLVQPSTPGLVVTPRPGVALVIELPLVSAGDIDGTLVRAGGGTMEGMDLELITVEGRVAATTRSDFDGFFLFEGVPYGRYTVRIARLSAEAVKVSVALNTAATVDAHTPSVHLGGVAAQPGETRQAVK
ncbi:carboxypeptidase regulatory-like domain-containing protein [Sphingomonas paeninsulae]|uniref:Carboxypeptidase regulatory-like domain-containing protein n=1 Tax=Sphingomonas paeninsulae TaxID=2319844 RepID=A0A494TBV8_SPHPE|nr:carboxypeptidase-like regulatory domain-containing protein [Sphingomonas paeninsulae]AYJ86630.1 carboxypeptidase regulatory-like domain-containing protein [Sphingomonas paeninsulae]